jgi:hypothetical protein
MIVHLITSASDPPAASTARSTFRRACSACAAASPATTLPSASTPFCPPMKTSDAGPVTLIAWVKAGLERRSAGFRYVIAYMADVLSLVTPR